MIERSNFQLSNLLILVFLGLAACSQKSFNMKSTHNDTNGLAESLKANENQPLNALNNQASNSVGSIQSDSPATQNQTPETNLSVSVGHLCSSRLTNLAKGNVQSLAGDLIVQILDSTGQNLLCQRSGPDIRLSIMKDKKMLLPKDCQGLVLDKVRVRVVAKTDDANTSENFLFGQVFSSVVHSVVVPYKDLYPVNANRSIQTRLGLGGVGGNYTGWGIAPQPSATKPPQTQPPTQQPPQPQIQLTHSLYVLVGDSTYDSCDLRDPQ